MGNNWSWGVASYDNSDTDVNGIVCSVPDRRLWHILSIYLTFTASDTAGNRYPTVQVQSSGSTVVLELFATNPAVAASGLVRLVFGGGMAPHSTEVYDTDLYMGALPSNLLLGPGYKIVALDASSIDIDSDAWTLTITRNSKGIQYSGPAV
jgi:hypothetical protein